MLNNTAMHNMAWLNYQSRQKRDFKLSHWTSWIDSIHSVDIWTQRLMPHDNRNFRMDPLVVPYLAQVAILLDQFPEEGVHLLARQLSKVYTSCCADRVEAVKVFCEGLLKNLSQPDSMITTTLVRSKLIHLMSSMPEPPYGDLCYQLRSAVDHWLNEAWYLCTKAAFFSDLAGVCTNVIQRYLDHVLGSLHGGVVLCCGVQSPVSDKFLHSVECELNVTSNLAMDFRQHCMSVLASQMLLKRFDSAKPLPYTAYKPLQFAVERLVFSNLTSMWLHDPLLVKQARTTMMTTFGIDEIEAQSRLDSVLFR